MIQKALLRTSKCQQIGKPKRNLYMFGHIPFAKAETGNVKNLNRPIMNAEFDSVIISQ